MCFCDCQGDFHAFATCVNFWCGGFSKRRDELNNTNAVCEPELRLDQESTYLLQICSPATLFSATNQNWDSAVPNDWTQKQSNWSRKQPEIRGKSQWNWLVSLFHCMAKHCSHQIWLCQGMKHISRIADNFHLFLTNQIYWVKALELLLQQSKQLKNL